MGMEEPNQNEQTGLSQAAQAAIAAMDGLPSVDNGLSEGIDSIISNKKDEITNPEVENVIKNTDPEDSKQVTQDLLKDEVNTSSVEGSDGSTVDHVELEGEVESGVKPNIEEELSEDKKVFIESDVFGGKLEVKGSEKEESLSFEVPKEANDFIKSKTGFDSLDDLVGSHEESLKKISEYEEISSKYSHVETLFNSMPAELYQAVSAFNNGENWKDKLISRPDLDFSSNVESIPDKSLVDTYLPGKFTQEQWEEYNDEDGDSGIKMAIDMAVTQSKEKFLNDKKELNSVREREATRISKFNESFSASIDKSIEHLKGNINGVADSYIETIKKELTLDNLNKMFLNDDGTFKEDAALRYTMAVHGQGMIKQYETVANHKAETKERQGILDRTPEKPIAKNKISERKDNISESAQRRLDEIRGGGFDARPTY